MVISDSYEPAAKGKYNYDTGIALFDIHKQNPDLVKIFDNHAYIYTPIADLFDQAKECGVIISKYFLW